MSVDFTTRTFFHPVAIARMRRAFERSQWFTPEQFERYQTNQLGRILRHAYRTVPYYRTLMQRLQLHPGDFRSVSDLQQLPILSKETLRNQFAALQSTSAHAYGARLVRTSGTTGEPISFLLDTPSNVLEFVYYWRHWSWAGYKLRRRFAEFSSDYFIRKPERTEQCYVFDRLTGRLLLNSMSVSEARVHDYVRGIRRYRPCFLKGLASVLHVFAHFARRLKYDLHFRAIFSTGEMLLAHQRRDIEQTFGCKVYDSYGHMERTVAVSECPTGAFHINPEYGVMELIPVSEADMPGLIEPKPGITLARVVGSGLHNFSMPLVRYDTGDFAEISPEATPCSCGRYMPRIRRINGRQQDIITTPDGRVITALFIVFNKIPGILSGQLIQYEPARLLVRIARTEQYDSSSEERLSDLLRQFVGAHMSIEFAYVDSDSFAFHRGTKYRAVISYVSSGTAAAVPASSP